MSHSEWADQDYYGDLGVSSDATKDEIRRAYRKLARENHPDTNPDDPEKLAKFKAAASAYDVLGDESKRKEYDDFKAMLRSSGGRFGGAGFPGGFRSSSSGFFSQGSPGRSRSTTGSFEDGGLGDIFGSFFNSGGSGDYQARPTRGADVETSITLDFQEAAKGTTIPLELRGQAPCTTCHGSGSKSGHLATCGQCNGSGFTSENRGAFGFSQPCSNCGGTGTKITDPCPTCSGSGTVNRTRSITVRIPAGVVDGQKVRLAGQGEAGPQGKPAGDLFVTVTVREDPVFSREGDDLLIEVPVAFSELALGDTITVPTLDAPVRVKIPAGTPDGRTLRVRGRGIKKSSGKHGDLHVTVRVAVPGSGSLDDAAKSALRSYAQAEKDSGFNARAGWAGNPK